MAAPESSSPPRLPPEVLPWLQGTASCLRLVGLLFAIAGALWSGLALVLLAHPKEVVFEDVFGLRGYLGIIYLLPIPLLLTAFTAWHGSKRIGQFLQRPDQSCFLRMLAWQRSFYYHLTLLVLVLALVGLLLGNPRTPKPWPPWYPVP